MKRIALLALALSILPTACTQQQRARALGGTADVEIKAGHKVIGVGWKKDALWILTRPMHDGEVPEVALLTESSSFGVIEGHVRLVERDSQETAHRREVAAKSTPTGL